MCSQHQKTITCSMPKLSRRYTDGNLEIHESFFHLFLLDAFKQMKKGVTFINVARGSLVDEKALYDALKSGQVSCADKQERSFCFSFSTLVLDQDWIRQNTNQCPQLILFSAFRTASSCLTLERARFSLEKEWRRWRWITCWEVLASRKM